jgi:hypothetical protein
VVFWVVMCVAGYGCQRVEGTVFLGAHLQVHTASQPVRPPSTIACYLILRKTTINLSYDSRHFGRGLSDISHEGKSRASLLPANLPVRHVKHTRSYAGDKL